MALLLMSGSLFAQQASITLLGSDATLANYRVVDWSLQKTGAWDAEQSRVLWSVSATRGSATTLTLAANGFVRVQNSGSAPATIGNIVVNLQRTVGKSGAGNKWVTISSDIADATQGDAATFARISPQASAEGLGSFSENTASGPLEFMDADNNTAFSLTPQVSLAPGQAVNLLFSAKFNNALLALPAGTLARIEIIVSFGNAGARGGSGSVSSNIDINGNGVIDADERKVRSVPTRLTCAVPAAFTVNDSVLLRDDEITSTGTVTLGPVVTDIGNGAQVEVISQSVQRRVTVPASGGADGGEACNIARLQGVEYSVAIVTGQRLVGYDVNGLPIYEPVYTCIRLVPALDLMSQSCVPIPGDNGGDPEILPDGTFYSYTQGGWGATPRGNNPASILAASFAAVYPNDLVLGSGCTLRFTSAAAVRAYLPAGGPPAALTASLVDPTSTSAGVFGGQVTALRINVDFSAAGVTVGPGGPVGAMRIVGTGTPLDNLTVAQALAIAEAALGDGLLPAGMTLPNLNDLVTDLNEAFDNGIQSVWARNHLAK
ncbi:MAG: hypothetical protein HZC54_15260 [Verrucomicrobia bacterium]|nr:hypothetical protein [Verrucomicrobiota bacterium]